MPVAEEGWLDHEATRIIAKEYLQELIDFGIDTLILGCTHYPLLSQIIQEIMGENVKLIDSGYAASLEVETYLNGRGDRNGSNQLGSQKFL